MKKIYRWLYNHDMGSIPQCLTPVLTSGDQDVTRQQVQQFVWNVADTDVDAFLCCPTMLRRVLWRSEWTRIGRRRLRSFRIGVTRIRSWRATTRTCTTGCAAT